MSVTRLAWRNIAGRPYRSLFVCLNTMLLAGLALSTALLVRGAQDSLHRALDRLGADVVVVPQGTQSRIETALLAGTPVTAWMPRGNLEQIGRVPGVARLSPQLYLASLANASCCSSELFLVAFDPQTDFTVTPWLNTHLDGGLQMGEVIGGSAVFVPFGEADIRLYGSHVALKGNLDPTGAGIDQTLFLTFETARDIANHSYTRAERPLEIPPDSISAALVQVSPGQDPRVVALQIMHDVPGVTAVPSLDFFQTFRAQFTGLLHALLALLAVVAALSFLFTTGMFALAANERRREMGILRACGATRGAVLRTLLVEAAILALGGGIAGTALSILVITLFRNLLTISVGGGFLLPALPTLLGFVGGGVVLALVALTLAALLPALQVSRQEPASAMRE
jgi:putative ABC transport system permease protein